MGPPGHHLNTDLGERRRKGKGKSGSPPAQAPESQLPRTHASTRQGIQEQLAHPSPEVDVGARVRADISPGVDTRETPGLGPENSM